MKAIHQKFKEFTKISDSDFEIFSSKLSREIFPKKSFLLQSGQTENYLSFIESGIVRFFIEKEDFDMTFGFAFENNFFGAYDSFITQKPCIYGVQAISDTVVWRISFEDLEEVYEESACGEKIGRKIAEGIYLKKMKRELSLLQDSATQRYLDLFTKQPQLIREIPLKYIAS